MARQRRSTPSMVSRSVSQGAISSLGCGSCTGLLPGLAGVISDTHQGNSQILLPRMMMMPVRNKGQAWKTDSLHLLLQKDLRASDIGSLGRIILPKKESEVHLPSLTLKGVVISMEDFDTRMTWSFQYRYWPNNRSRMYLLEGTGEFVKAHDLEEGDLLMIYKNRQGNFVIRGKKKGLCSEACVPITTTTTTTTTAVHLPNNNNTHSLARVPFGGAITVKKAEEEPLNDGKKSLHRNVPPVEDCSSYKPLEPFDIFLQEVMQGQGIQNEYEQCGEVLSQLERFPSLDPDGSVDDILGLTFAGGSGSGGISSVVPKIEPAS